MSATPSTTTPTSTPDAPTTPTTTPTATPTTASTTASTPASTTASTSSTPAVPPPQAVSNTPSLAEATKVEGGKFQALLKMIGGKRTRRHKKSCRCRGCSKRRRIRSRRRSHKRKSRSRSHKRKSLRRRKKTHKVYGGIGTGTVAVKTAPATYPETASPGTGKIQAQLAGAMLQSAENSKMDNPGV